MKSLTKHKIWYKFDQNPSVAIFFMANLGPAIVNIQ